MISVQCLDMYDKNKNKDKNEDKTKTTMITTIANTNEKCDMIQNKIRYDI